LIIGVFAPINRVSLTQNFRYKELSSINHFSCQKTRMNVLCGVRMSAQVSFVLSQRTRLTDRQTDGQEGLENTVRCITCSRTVKVR